tara:strand:- start:784 stop:939 length:156 start_codon:yes stop_codon:yes gene_type:complete
MNFLENYLYYIFWGLIFLFVLYHVPKALWFLCALDNYCYVENMKMMGAYNE